MATNRKFSTMLVMRQLVMGRLADPLAQALKGLTDQFNIALNEEEMAVFSQTLLAAITEELTDVDLIKDMAEECVLPPLAVSALPLTDSIPNSTLDLEPCQDEPPVSADEESDSKSAAGSNESPDHVDDDQVAADLGRQSERYFPVLRDMHSRIVEGVSLNVLIEHTAALPIAERPAFKTWMENVNRVPLKALADPDRLLLIDFQRIFPYFHPPAEDAKSDAQSQSIPLKACEPTPTVARKRGRKGVVGRKTSKRTSDDDSAPDVTTKAITASSASTAERNNIARIAAKKKGLGWRQKKLLEDENWLAYFGQLMEWETKRKSFNVPRDAVVTSDGVIYRLGDWLHKQRLLLSEYFDRDTEKYEMLTMLAERGLWTTEEMEAQSDASSGSEAVAGPVASTSVALPQPAPNPPSPQQPRIVPTSATVSKATRVSRSSQPIPSTPSLHKEPAATPDGWALTSNVADDKTGGGRLSNEDAKAAGEAIVVFLSNATPQPDASAEDKQRAMRKRRKIVFHRTTTIAAPGHISSIEDSEDSDSDSTYTRSSVSKDRTSGRLTRASHARPSAPRREAVAPSAPFTSRASPATTDAAQPKPSTRPDSRHLARKSFVRKSDCSEEESDASPSLLPVSVASASIDAWNRNLTGQYIAYRRLNTDGEKVLTIGMVTKELLENSRKEWEVSPMRASDGLDSEFTVLEAKSLLGYGDLLITNIAMDSSRRLTKESAAQVRVLLESHKLVLY